MDGFVIKICTVQGRFIQLPAFHDCRIAEHKVQIGYAGKSLYRCGDLLCGAACLHKSANLFEGSFRISAGEYDTPNP